jgi:CBS domain-containing protein
MTSVRDIMDTEVVTVHPEDEVESVLRLLRRHDLPGVPVVDHRGRCVGIVTESDLVIADEQGDLHLPHYIELFGGVVYLEPLKRFEERIHKAFASKVRDMMSSEPVTITAGASVEEAARIIATKRHNRLPVVEDGRLVGVVTRLDVLDALHGELPAAS